MSSSAERRPRIQQNVSLRNVIAAPPVKVLGHAEGLTSREKQMPQCPILLDDSRRNHIELQRRLGIPRL
eukprot:1050884-Rhodomonas_salina.5